MALRRPVLWLVITIASVCAWTVYLYAHGGGLDAHGCHNNRKAGGYHCHRGPYAGESFGSKEEMLKRGAAGKQKGEVADEKINRRSK